MRSNCRLSLAVALCLVMLGTGSQPIHASVVGSGFPSPIYQPSFESLLAFGSAGPTGGPQASHPTPVMHPLTGGGSGYIIGVSAGSSPHGCFATANGPYVHAVILLGYPGYCGQQNVTASFETSVDCVAYTCTNLRGTGVANQCVWGYFQVPYCFGPFTQAGTYTGSLQFDVYTNTNPPVYQFTVTTNEYKADVFPLGSPVHKNHSCPAANKLRPCNVLSGELWYSYTDAALSGPFGLTFTRFYSSQLSYSGDLGANWRHTYDAYLDVSQLAASGQVSSFARDGSQIIFSDMAAGKSSYDSVSGSTLGLNAAGSQYTLTTFGNTVFNFDSSGRLLSITDRSGNQQTVNRDSTHGYRITSVTDALGRSLTFGYDSQNRIVSVTSTPAGVSLTMTYDSGSSCAAGDLCSLKESDGKTWSYQYDTANPTYPRNLTKVTDPNGNPEEINSYTGNQLAEQYTGTDSIGNRLNDYTFTYNLVPAYTVVTDGLKRTTTFYADAYGNVGSVVGPLCECVGGQSMGYGYDAYGRLVTETDGDGATHQITYAYGRDALSGDGKNVIVTAYPGPTQVTQPLSSGVSRTTNLTYYPIGDPRQDLPNSITVPSADTSGQVETITDAYSTAGLLTSEIVQGYVGGVQTTYARSYTYDSRGRIMTALGPRTDVQQKTTFAYFPDADADLARRGQLQSVTDALSHVTSFAGAPSPYNSYTVYGDPKSITDANGQAIDFTYDATGRILSSILTGSPALTESLTYDAAGRVTKLKRPLGNALSFVYDVANRPNDVIRVDSSGKQQEELAFLYDVASEPISVGARWCSSPAPSCPQWYTGASVGAQYDGYGRISQLNYSPGTVAFTYDAAGNLATVQDQNHSAPNATYGYDYANRRTSLTQTLAGAPGGTITTFYGYDVQDNLNSVTDPNGNLTTLAFDDFARVRKQTSPVSGVTAYAYDQDDNPLTVAVGSGTDAMTTTRTFDALNRVLSATSTRSGYTSETVNWTYDDPTSGHFGIGRLATMTDPTGSVKYTYERRGLVASEARTILGTVYNLAYGYDHNGNRNSLTYPDNSIVSYAFDWADRPISATSGSTQFVTSATYKPFGPIASLAFGKGTTQTFTYDGRYRPSEDKVVYGSTTLADYVYAEDAVGNITQIHDSTNAAYNRDFMYDDLNRLTTANSGSSLWGSSTNNGYAYDAMGNLKSLQLGSGRTATFAYSSPTPKLTSVTENGTPRTVTYDNAGNELMVGSASYTYTPRNLLALGDNLSYVYDGWGMRVVSTSASGSRYSFYGPDLTLLAETNVSSHMLAAARRAAGGRLHGAPAIGNMLATPQPAPPAPTPFPMATLGASRPGPQVLRLRPNAMTSSLAPTVAYDYIYFGGRPIAQIDSTGVHYTAADHLGTPLLQTDASGNVYWRAEYEPYGKVWALRAGDVHQPLRFPGQVAEQFDAGANGATERDYNTFRWYRPGWGRYSQADPADLAGGINVYEYTGASPIGSVDEFGLRGGPTCYRDGDWLVCVDPGRSTIYYPDPDTGETWELVYFLAGFLPGPGQAEGLYETGTSLRNRDAVGTAFGLACLLPAGKVAKIVPWAFRISRHHILPQQFRPQFARIFGSDIIDQYTIPMTNAEHYKLHPEWNRVWQDFLKTRGLTPTDVWGQARKMMNEHGLCECNLRSYR